MSSKFKLLLLLTCLIPGISQAADPKPLIKLSDAARRWVVHDGQPLYYSSGKASYNVDSRFIRQLSNYNSDALISLSPNADYRLLNLLQDMDQVKNDQRYSDYFILNSNNELVYKVSRGSGADLKPHVAAISDYGVLALADPVRAHIYFYQDGVLSAEGQLYETEGDYSLERKIHVQWVEDQCFVLLERPGRDGRSAGNVLFIRINEDGRGQITTGLPFAYLQQFIIKDGRIFISGYDYNPQTEQMQPQIIEVSTRGKVLWSNAHFGHEIAISPNGEYLAARSSHNLIQLFNLEHEKVSEIQFEHENKVALGLTVNDRGETAVIRVPLDFFVKRTTHFAEVYFPTTNRSTDIQLDPRYHKLFQLYTDGDRFFIGTNYEWLEISE